MTIRKRAIVFDVGRVLLDWDPRYLYRKLLSDNGAIDAFFDEVGFFDWNLGLDRGQSWQEGVTLLSEQFPHRRDLIEAADKRWHEMISGPITGTVVILDTLKNSGMPLYAITNFSSEKWPEACARFPFLLCFRDVVVSGDEKLLKPDPEIYQLLLNRNNLVADDCIFIDDSKPNVEAASELGMDAIWFQSPAQLETELRGLGVLD